VLQHIIVRIILRPLNRKTTLESVPEMIGDLSKRGEVTMLKREMFTEISRLDMGYFTEI
jgi:hypothetical protein